MTTSKLTTSIKLGRYLLVAAAALLIVSCCIAFEVDAQDSRQAVKALAISPLRTELGIEPGTSQNGTLTVSNTTNDTLEITMSAESFRVVNDNYDYAFDQETEVSGWVTFDRPTFTLAKDEERQIGYAIGVPLTTEPAGRYLSLFASSDTPSDDGSVDASQRVGSLVYITVLGDVTRLGEVIKLNTPVFVGGSDAEWSASVRNGGTTHFRARYNVTIQNIFGGDTVATGTGDALILPGTIRRISNVVPLPAMPGIYKAQYTIGLGDTPGHVEARYIIYLPPVVAAVSILAIILTAALIFQGKRRKPNRSVERQYK